MKALFQFIAHLSLLGSVLFAHAVLADTITSSVVITIAINAPSNLSAAANSSTQVNLTWTDNSSNESGFSVERKTGSGGTYAQIATTTADIATYLDSGLAASTTYFYRVRAFDATSYSDYSNEVSATTNAPAVAPAPAIAASGGGGQGLSLPFSTKVIFKGKAYPDSNVTLLKDAQIVATTKADPDASFEIAIQDLSAGTYTFGVWAEDAQGDRSITQTFTVSITAGVTITIGGIFIPPFLGLDKSEVKRGDILTFYGVTVPGGNVSVFVNSENEVVAHTTSSPDGTWIYKFDTDPLEYGDHTARARAAKDADITSFGRTRTFVVGDRNVEAPVVERSVSRGDVDGDQRVNLADFSILAYWYKRPDPPAKVDLSGDGKVDLVDFSIMAYYWTG